MRKLTTSEFIDKAKEIHGDAYDYSKVNYKNALENVCIVCPEHGAFYQMPHNHLKGQGCPICRYIKSSNSNKLGLNEFIKRSKQIHGDKYNYSKVKYVDNKTKVCIICPEHGEFWQTPSKHTHRKQGCPYCSGNARKTTEQFIKEANQIHNNKYDYSKVNYKCNSKPVCIICPEHGEFWQRPKDHLKGQGCPHCKQSKIEKEVFEMLVDNKIKFEQQFKYDSTNFKNRLDFIIKDKNIAIECQGEQHFKPVDFANKGNEWANESFEKNLLRDNYKHALCEKKGIKLLYYIPKKNTIPGYKSNKKFNGIYTNDNVCNNLSSLKAKIEGISFDNI